MIPTLAILCYNLFNMEKIHHFYHVYSNGSWEIPLTEHIKALADSELLKYLDTFQIGLVGSPHTRERVKQYLDSENINYSICVEVDDGWEQETQDMIWEFSKKNDGYIFYAHTKNSVNINPLHVAWRKSMTYFNVILWKLCVDLLDQDYCAVGCHYLEGGNEFTKTESGFFAGTYWWTHLKYVRNFPHKPLRTSRYDAEGWIGLLKGTVENMGKEFKIYDFVPYHPIEQSRMVTTW